MYLHVRVVTNSKKESVTQKKEHTFLVAVAAKPQRGDANRRVKTLLAEHLGINQKQLRLIRGATSPSKLYTVHTDTNKS